MLAAVHAMSAGWQTAFFAAATVLLLVAAARSVAPKLKAKVDLVALGLAAFVFVFAWNAFAAT